MWMIGYNDNGDFNGTESFNGHKLRPLIPRPVPRSNNPSTAIPPCLSRIHGTEFFGLNHHLGSHFGDQNKREFSTPPVVVSSRWNPTSEQLRTLEELYRRGTRTPSAEQIQNITAQLRRYGKIEGKNVFYWFQNHKARERQKRRRQIESATDHDDNNHETEICERNNKDSAASKTAYEVEQTKNWAAPTNCCTLSEESVSVQKTAKAALVADCREGGWIQFDETGESQYRKSFTERNATWQMMQLSCPPPTHLINTPSTTCTTTPYQHQTATTSTALRAKGQKQLTRTNDLNIFISPYRESSHDYNHFNIITDEDDGHGENQTLQLFPLRSGDGLGNNSDKVTKASSAAAIDANLTRQFFEFLPLKN